MPWQFGLCSSEGLKVDGCLFVRSGNFQYAHFTDCPLVCVCVGVCVWVFNGCISKPSERLYNEVTEDADNILLMEETAQNC